MAKRTTTTSDAVVERVLTDETKPVPAPLVAAILFCSALHLIETRVGDVTVENDLAVAMTGIDSTFCGSIRDLFAVSSRITIFISYKKPSFWVDVNWLPSGRGARPMARLVVAFADGKQPEVRCWNYGQEKGAL